MTLGVRESTAWVMARARWVAIDERALAALAERLAREPAPQPTWDHRYHLEGPPPALAQYLLLLDALNFSFWGEPKWSIEFRGERLDGYWALAAALTRAVQQGVPLLDAAALAELDHATLAAVLAGSSEIPLLEERLAHAREVGRVLCTRYGRQAATLVAAAGGSAVAFVRRVVADFPSFDDRASYAGKEVRFYKRAQLLAADLAAAGVVPPWPDEAELTVFADYQLPRVLRAAGVLVYAPELATRIDQRRELAAGSPEEVEIRAATVVACEQLCAALAARGAPLTAVALDQRLWWLAQGALPNDRPYHRTRTVFY
ncbi:MAG: hypothetical protein KatS3mg061_2546 [Dehalococcoidia bacterium]|nr:MAG: hypothetical protein KatS3mg061_2546 [Dehalococcoidia bacterium]